MPWFLVIVLLSLISGHVSEARKHHSPAVVVGTVYCDTCFQRNFPLSSQFISGASVAVECKNGISKPNFRTEAKTDAHGEFKVQLPFTVSRHMNRIKGCTVSLISSNEPYCTVASSATSSSLHLKSKTQKEHIFSAGFFSFKPLKQPNICNQKPKVSNHKDLNPIKTSYSPNPNPNPTLPPQIQYPPRQGAPLLPPLLPPLPPLPPLPSLPPLLPSLPPLPVLPLLPPPLLPNPPVVIPPPVMPPPVIPPPVLPSPYVMMPPPVMPITPPSAAAAAHVNSSP